MRIFTSLVFIFVCSLSVAQAEDICTKELKAIGPLQLPFFNPKTPFEIGWGFDVRRYRSYDDAGNVQAFAEFNDIELHPGIDLRVDPGTPVINLRPGRIESLDVFHRDGPLEANFRIREVDAEGKDTLRLWDYAHLNGAKVPARIAAAFKNKEILKPGTVLGVIRPWLFMSPPQQFDHSDGHLYHHLHFGLEVGGTFCNVLPLLPYKDRIAPTVQNIFWIDSQNQGLSEITRRATFGIAIEMFDQVNSGHNPRQISPFRLHEFRKIQWKIINPKKQVVAHDEIEGLLSSDSNSKEWKKPFLKTILRGQAPPVEFEGGVERRVFLVNLTYRQTLDPSQWDAGIYDFDLIVEDFQGNQRHLNKSLEIKN